MDGPIRAPVVLKSFYSFRKAIGCSAKPRILSISLNRLINYMNTNTYVGLRSGVSPTSGADSHNGGQFLIRGHCFSRHPTSGAN